MSEIDVSLVTGESTGIDVSLSSSAQTIGVDIADGGFILTPATRNRLGGVIVGDNINVTSNGTISVPDASTTTKGVIEIATDEEASAGASETLAVTPKQLSTKQDVLVSGTNIKTINNESILGNGNIDIDSLPNQSGENGKFLTTNGTVASWANVPVSSVNNKTGVVTLSASDVGALPDSTVIPDVNNGILTIQKNGTAIDTFGANSSSDVTVNITVPTDTNDLTNGAGFQDASDVSTAISTHNSALDAHSNIITPITNSISGIEEKIPTQASSSNQLADKNFVNSSIATNTANFIGTFNSVADLEAYSGTVTNNDYAFVVGTDASGNTVYNRYKYTTATNPASWVFEYALNNSSFTSAQWGAINSGATSSNISQISTNTNSITGIESTINGYGDIVTHDADEFATAAQGSLADTAVQPGDLATVATSGNYNDLSNKPTIPTVYNATLTIQKNGTTVQTFTANSSTNKTADITVPTDTSDLTNGAGFITGISSGDVTSALGYTPVNPSSLATVATSGSYADLSNKPTIPTVNNATLTITQGGVSKGTFTANASTDVTIALDSGGSGTDLPDQTGHSGEFLTTNGTAASWGAAPVTSVNSKTGAVALTASDVGALPDSTVIPAAQVNSDWNAASGVAQILNKPTIPTVNDSTITITQGGVTKGSFTLNQSSGDTIALDAGGGGSTEVEWATYGTTTHQQVFDWATAGKEVLCLRANLVYRLSYYNTSSDGIMFSAYQGSGLTFSYLLLQTNNNWYAGGSSGEYIFRYSSMPTAAVAYNNKLVQYIGTTDANYTNGYFYKCVSDGGSPATYSWVQTDVQPAGSGSLPSQTGNSGKFLTTDGTDASWANVPKEIEYATYGTTTYQQISDWLTAGKDVLCIYNGKTYRYGYDSAGHWLVCVNPGAVNLVYVQTNNTWSSSQRLKQDRMQYSTMPTANLSNEGKILQYVGTTDADYTNGYFYICVNNGGVYSWQQIDVQPVDSHRVIAFQAPTAQNNYTWCRKYADGWVEMGGRTTQATTTQQALVLPVTMADANYQVLANVVDDNLTGYAFCVQVKDKTTTGFKTQVYASYQGGIAASGYSFDWEVKGMAA